jgi:hypothetical protein
MGRRPKLGTWLRKKKVRPPVRQWAQLDVTISPIRDGRRLSQVRGLCKAVHAGEIDFERFRPYLCIDGAGDARPLGLGRCVDDCGGHHSEPKHIVDMHESD